MNRIPIRNVYVMLAYASRDAGLLDDRAIAAGDFERPLDLVGRILNATMRRLRQQGLDRQYLELHEQGTEPRGAISIERSIARLLPAQGQLAWTVDDLVVDTPCNRLVKCALRHLMNTSQVDRALRLQLRAHIQWLSEVQDIGALDAIRAPVRAPAGLPAYRPALRLSRLVLEHLLPDEGRTGRAWRSLLNDPKQLGDLFESFVRGFAVFELAEQASVSVRKLSWELGQHSTGASQLLPEMRTDVFIEWRHRPPTVGECKFYSSPLAQPRFGSEKKLRSQHLYQLMAYLRATERVEGVKPRGLLVYARVDEGMLEDLVLEGFNLRVATLDLSQEWDEVRGGLLTILSENPSRMV